MCSLVIIVVKIFIQAGIKFKSVFRWIKVNMFSFKGTKKAFNVNVIKSPPFAINTDFNGLFGEKVNPFFTGELTSLIGINNLRLSVLLNRCFKHVQACSTFKGVGYSPSYNKAAVYCFF
jgi:hypothetical protein